MSIWSSPKCGLCKWLLVSVCLVLWVLLPLSATFGNVWKRYCQGKRRFSWVISKEEKNLEIGWKRPGKLKMHGVIKQMPARNLKDFKTLETIYQFFVQEIDKTSHFHIAKMEIWSASFSSFSYLHTKRTWVFQLETTTILDEYPTEEHCRSLFTDFFLITAIRANMITFQFSSIRASECQILVFPLNSKSISKDEKWKCAFILVFTQRAWGAHAAAFPAAGVSRTKRTHLLPRFIALHAEADGALRSRDLGRPSPTFLSTYNSASTILNVLYTPPQYKP